MSIPWFAVSFASFCAALLFAPVLASAQTGSLFGSQGPTAQSNLGGLRSGTTVGGSGIGAGTGSLGAASASPLSTSGATGLGTTGTTGTFGSGSGFVGRNFSSERFVGIQQAGQTGATGLGAGQNQYGMSNVQRGNQQRNRDSGFQDAGPTSQTNGQSQIVVRPKIAFPVPERSASAVGNRLTAQLARIATREPDLRRVELAVGPRGEVTLRGRVSTENARNLAAALVRLEPGIRSVRNELVVAPAE